MRSTSGATGCCPRRRPAGVRVWSLPEDVTNPVGAVCGFAPPGDIHKVWNGCQEKAISLHIYGADISRLGSSVRRVYDVPADR